MLKIQLTRTTCDAYGLYDYRVIPFGGTPYITISGEIYLDDEQIGRMTMYELSNDINLEEMAYQIPGDILVIAENICDNNGKIKEEYAVNEKFVILDNIFIEPEYRNKGYGTLAVKHLFTTLNDAYNWKIGTIVVYASAYDFDDIEEANIDILNNNSEKLIKFYQKSKFEHIGNNVMIRKGD